jgi:eukaryotic-like serine/threonine-protein kinase
VSFDPGSRFTLNRKLGAGSFGIVYEALDHYRNRSVALKVLERAAPETVTRFKREFRYLAELRHPNLASMYELLVLGERWVLSMELVLGAELLEYLAFTELQNSFMAKGSTTDRLTVSTPYVENVRDTFRQLAVAVAVLHSRDIVHRDLKPSNIMITSEGRVVLLDFGLIVEVELDETIDRRKVVGTPGYMSPEQMTAEMPTPASDWYSFGVLLYQALTGQMPFIGQTALEVMEKQMQGDVVPATEIVSGVPKDLSELAADLLRRDPGDRAGDIDILRRLGVTGFDPLRGTRMRERNTELFGRTAEVRTLFEHVTKMDAGRSRLVLVHGSPGAGKTALIDGLLDRVRAETDSLIIGGRCHAWESLPMNAVDALVDSLARAIRRERARAVDDVMSRVVAATRLFPSLVMESADSVGEETIAVPSGQKLVERAATELAAIIAAAAGDRPIVMMLDDAQWGDYQSAAMFLRIFQGLASLRLVFILGYRTEDWRTSLLLQTMLHSELETREVTVEELPLAALTQFVKKTIPDADKELIDEIRAQSGGNPVLTQMIAGQILASGHNGGGLLAQAIRTRLERMSPPAQRIFALLLSSEGALAEDYVEETLELIETDEPLRSLSRERLIRIRRTGDLHEVDLYHPRMRKL